MAQQGFFLLKIWMGLGLHPANVYPKNFLGPTLTCTDTLPVGFGEGEGNRSLFAPLHDSVHF